MKYGPLYLARTRIIIMSEFVFPGQDLGILLAKNLKNYGENDNIKVQAGPGMIQNSSDLISLRPGRFHYLKQNSKLILESPQKRYIPLQNDLVIGIVTARLSEFFRVDIGSQSTATLSLLTGFDNATKKNRPSWNVGTIIFARVSMAHSELDPELACFDPSGKISAELFGQLGENENIPPMETSKSKSNYKSFLLLRTSCNYSRKLQNPGKDSLLSIIGRYFTFGIAAGANGRIFLESNNIRETAAISQLILKMDSENLLNHDQIELRVKKLAISLGKLRIEK